MYCPKTKLQAKARADAAQSFAAGKKALEEDMLSWAFLLSNCFVQSACPPVDRWWFLYPALTSMPCPEPILIWIGAAPFQQIARQISRWAEISLEMGQLDETTWHDKGKAHKGFLI